MIEAAVSFPGARSIKHREGLARIEAGLIHLGGARVRGRVRGEKGILPEKRYARILAEKLERGEWIEVKPPIRYRDAGGAVLTFPRIITLARPYLLRLIAADTGERYAGMWDYLTGRPLPERVPVCRDLPPDLARYLGAGTGLEPDHETALHIMDAGGAVRGWRAISLMPPERILRPSWGPDRERRIHASHPPLQHLKREYRRAGALLSRAGDLVELDFSSCHPNIARIIAGLPPVPDVYRELASLFDLTRDQVKAMVTAILGGRTREQHIYRYGRTLAPVWDEVRRVLPVPRERLMEIETDIMWAILRQMSTSGMPIGLPLHDSLLTAYPLPVLMFMQRESERILGRPLPVKSITIGPELPGLGSIR